MSAFNAEPNDTGLSNFCKINNLKNLVEDIICFRNLKKTEFY